MSEGKPEEKASHPFAHSRVPLYFLDALMGFYYFLFDAIRREGRKRGVSIRMISKIMPVFQCPDRKFAQRWAPQVAADNKKSGSLACLAQDNLELTRCSARVRRQR